MGINQRANRAIKWQPATGFDLPRPVLFLVGAALLFPGCSDGDSNVLRVPVDAAVSNGGTPVAEGTLILTPAEGNSGPKSVIAVVNGRASISEENGPGLGLYVASFRAGDPASGDRASLAPGDSGLGTPVIAAPQPVEWEVTMTDGLNELSLDVQSASE